MVWHGWEACGVRGQGDLPPLAGQAAGPLLVCGSGRGLHDDAARVPAAVPVLAVNLAAFCVGRPVLHLASLHADLVGHFLAILRQQQAGHVHTHAVRPEAEVENVWDLEGQPPCSGLFGAAVGLAMGYAPVILAGVPEDDHGHLYDPPGSPGTYVGGGNEQSWLWHRDNVFAGRVTSLSGRTRDWLGAPDGL